MAKKEKKSGNKESYFSLVSKEMKLVTWPTKKNVIKYSIVTIIMVLLLALFFMGISTLFSLIQGWIG